MITCDDVRAAVRAQLTFLEDCEFRFFSSFRHFRRAHANGCSYITINVVTHSPGTASLAFYLAVQLVDAERKKRELIGSTSKIGHYDRTIWCYTVNIGPGSPHWSYGIRGSWDLFSDSDLRDAQSEIGLFTRELSLPYVSSHVDPSAIRRTLLEEKGHAQNLRPYEEILTIDLLYMGRPQLTEDVDRLRTEYRSMVPEYRQAFERFVALIEKA